MPLKPNASLTPQKLLPKITRLFELSAEKILAIEQSWKPENGTPVFTVKGKYTSRGWTEWTQGFQFGSAILQFDATGDERFLRIGREGTRRHMASHVSHIGVHDHGFNNVSTYGNLLRLMREGRIPQDDREQDFYELALKVSGAVQAARWTKLADGTGFIHSFNGSHSLFVDTIRSCRSLAVAHSLGHVLMGEQDEKISLLQRLVEHALNTARYNIYYGEGRDTYDVRGRTAHEAVFNTASGVFRCPNSQQGYSPFSTWTRGLAWAICGFAEELEFLLTRHIDEITRASSGGRFEEDEFETKEQWYSSRCSACHCIQKLTAAACAASDLYMTISCADGVPMWDTGAPNLHRLPANYLSKPADPFNTHEPVDSSAATIAAQGFIRLGKFFLNRSKPRDGRSEWWADRIADAVCEDTDPRPAFRDLDFSKKAQIAAEREHSRNLKLLASVGFRYLQAGLSTADTLFSEPYLSTNPKHQGLILHSVYHRPNGWDYIAPGQQVPNGESSMWGDYHALELALLIQREAKGQPYLTFFGCVPKQGGSD